MAPVPRLTVRVAASPAGIRLAADAFDGFRAEHGLVDAVAWPLRVALDEILSNIVRHARPGPEGRVIEVTFALVDGGVEIAISDDGPEFDPLQVPEPDVTAPLEVRRPGGLGVHLVKRLMDRVEYTRADGRNRLVMTWRAEPPDPRAP